MRIFSTTMMGLAILAAPGIASATMVVDRGLPTANLNNVSGPARSNVAWDEGSGAFDGDSFTLPGGSGAVYSINTIRTWVVLGGEPTNNNSNLTDDGVALGDQFSALALYAGVGSTLSQVASGNFAGAGSNATDNGNISITRVNYSGLPASELDYEGNGDVYRAIFQVDISGLNIVATGGTTISFGIEGTGSNWFMHASNAGLSGSPQQSSDDLITCYNVSGPTATACGPAFSTLGNGWDKASDINVQVFADVPEPASLSILAASMIGLGIARRRRQH